MIVNIVIILPTTEQIIIPSQSNTVNIVINIAIALSSFLLLQKYSYNLTDH